MLVVDAAVEEDIILHKHHRNHAFLKGCICNPSIWYQIFAILHIVPLIAALMMCESLTVQIN